MSISHASRRAERGAPKLRTKLVVESPYVRRAARRRARCRLLCFPLAGAGASSFAAWPDLVPADVEVAAVQLPGREDRISERPFTRIEPLVLALAQALRPYVDPRCTFFGHSGGALLAFEVARALARRHALHVRLVVAGHRAPHLPPRTSPVHALPQPELVDELRRLGGTPPEVLANESLLAVVLPALRADFAWWEHYRFRPGKPLAARIAVVGAASDERCPPEDLVAWGTQTTATFGLKILAGTHFLTDEPAELVAAVVDELRA